MTNTEKFRMAITGPELKRQHRVRWLNKSRAVQIRWLTPDGEATGTSYMLFDSEGELRCYLLGVAHGNPMALYDISHQNPDGSWTEFKSNTAIE